MFVHVIFEHVRHDYAPIYTLDVESPQIAPNTVLHWEEQSYGGSFMERLDLFRSL